MPLPRDVFEIFDVQKYNDLEIRIKVIESYTIRQLAYGFH